MCGVLLLLLGGYAWINPPRAEHWALLVLVVALVVGSRATRDLTAALLPAAIFGLAYDLMRLLLDRDYPMLPTAWTVEAERRLFGWLSPASGELGPVDFFTQHNWLPLDLLAGLWYSTHVPSVILFGLFIWWCAYRERERAAERLDKYFWGFLIFNGVGMLVWALFPVAPPWYIQEFGLLAPQALDLPEGLLGSPAGLARVDAWLGYEHFAGIYEQSTYVFGAMPSLHAAAPAWVALWARRKWLRRFSLIYAGMMAFFALYLGHHYLVDVVAGVALAVAVYWMLEHTRVGLVFIRVNAWLREVLAALTARRAPGEVLSGSAVVEQVEQSAQQEAKYPAE